MEDSQRNNKDNKNSTLIKIGIAIFIALFMCLSITVLTGAGLWYGGFIQEEMCNVVKEDSPIAQRLECSTVTSTQYVIEEKKVTNPEVTDLEQVVTRVVEDSSDAVVGIGVHGNNLSSDQIVGSGFVVSKNGLVVTNHHVVSGGDPEDFFVVIGENGGQVAVNEIFLDEINDIALIRVDSENMSVLPLGDSSSLKVGQTAIAIGNPLGDLSNTVTVGTISALGREVEVPDNEFNFSSTTHSDVIQTDAAINPGNSGGPLINSNGEVVGVNFATIRGADNLSFAIPINIVKQRINELNETGSFQMPYLGVEYQERLVFFENESTVGAVVANVVPGSPAEKAGIESGDIIVQYNGVSLEDESLLSLIQKTPVGTEVEIVIIRDNRSQTLAATIEDRS